MPSSPQKGQMYRLRDGGTPQTKPRLIVVVSRREINGGSVVMAAPTTTQKLDERIGRKQYVVLEAGEGGATEKCVVQCDLISAYHLSEIATSQVWNLPPEKLPEIDEAIKYVFAL